MNKAVQQMKENRRSPFEQKPEAELSECLETPGIAVNAETVYLTVVQRDAAREL